MRLLAFLGLGIVILLFATTTLIGLNYYIISDCTCQIVMYYQDFYLFFNLGIALFFLMFCTLLLIRATEELELQKEAPRYKQEAGNSILTAPIYDKIYQLPLIKLFSKISIFGSLSIFVLAIATFFPIYDIVGNCEPSKCLIYFIEIESQMICYVLSGLYFSFLSFVVYKNVSKASQSQVTKNVL